MFYTLFSNRWKPLTQQWCFKYWFYGFTDWKLEFKCSRKKLDDYEWRNVVKHMAKQWYYDNQRGLVFSSIKYLFQRQSKANVKKSWTGSSMWRKGYDTMFQIQNNFQRIKPYHYYRQIPLMEIWTNPALVCNFIKSFQRFFSLINRHEI